MKDIEIKKIGKPEYAPWLLERHYARRLCSVMFAYGLYVKETIMGVITYGTGSVSTLSALGYVAVPVKGKHRYVFLVGNKREKREMMRRFSWPILPYPKGESRRYDAKPKGSSDVS